MPVYAVSYDLKKPGQKYGSLYDEMKNSPAWWHYLDSTWLIRTNEGAQNLSDRLLQHTDDSDRLLVIRVTNEYQGWLSQEAWDWIRENVGR